jgi:pyridoxal phosphate enzyme (YggS family)
MVEAAAAAGLREFGENYVKELEVKRSAAPDAAWHFLGRLQRNKLERVLRAASVIQTLEPGRAAERLIELASTGRSLPECLIEVDFTGGRVGVAPDELGSFADTVASAGVPLRGLMTVAPPGGDPRQAFEKLRELRDVLRDRHEEAAELSMGMSTDLEVAVEEGATMVRVGTAIFGRRRR